MDNLYEIKYGLYHIEKKKMLTYHLSSNGDADFCNDSTVELGLFYDDVWLVTNPKQAEWTRVFDQHWYNSSLEDPVCNIDSHLLKVVKVTIQKEYDFVDIEIPTIYEFYKDRYEEKEPDYWNSLKERIETLSPYSMWELHEYKNR